MQAVTVGRDSSTVGRDMGTLVLACSAAVLCPGQKSRAKRRFPASIMFAASGRKVADILQQIWIRVLNAAMQYWLANMEFLVIAPDFSLEFAGFFPREKSRKMREISGTSREKSGK